MITQIKIVDPSGSFSLIQRGHSERSEESLQILQPFAAVGGTPPEAVGGLQDEGSENTPTPQIVNTGKVSLQALFPFCHCEESRRLRCRDDEAIPCRGTLQCAPASGNALATFRIASPSARNDNPFSAAYIKLNNQAQSLIFYCLLIAVVVAALLAMSIVFRYSLQGKFRQSADVIGQGEQYEPGVTVIN